MPHSRTIQSRNREDHARRKYSIIKNKKKNKLFEEN